MKYQLCIVGRTSTAGITLVALIVTIVVLLILAGITIAYVLGDNSIFKLAQDAKNKTEDTIRNEQEDFRNLQNYMNEAMNGIVTKPENDGWIQDKTSVTNGTVTLEIGQVVTGYTANGKGDGNWFVLGAKDGKLLITTNSNQGTVKLSGRGGYANGVTTLNTESAKFKDTDNMAESARSINVEDINRVTGYDPEMVNYNNGNREDRWNNKITYTLNSDGKIHYQGTKYPTQDTISEYTSFTYWNDSNWMSLVKGESKTIIHNYYYYYPQTLSMETSSTNQINGSTLAYTLLFANTKIEYYWLGSQFERPLSAYCIYGVRYVQDCRVVGCGLYYSYGETFSASSGVRPVVTLKSNIKVASDGTLSM